MASLSVQRAMANDSDALKLCYDILEGTFKGNRILNKLMHIFNYDEKVIAEKESRNPSTICGDIKPK